MALASAALGCSDDLDSRRQAAAEEVNKGACEAYSMCDPAIGDTASVSIRVTAPEGIGEQHLGRPLNGKFQFLFGEQGKSIFPNAPPKKTLVNSMQHETTVIESSRGFDAEVGLNFGVWGGGVNAGNASKFRYGVYRASQIEYALEVDDSQPACAPTADSVFYIARLFYGHMYEVRFSGSASSFHIGVKAKYFVFNGGVSTFASNNKLQMQARGRGMVPKNDQAIFARDENQLRAGYSASGEAVPILVEYRSIPKACVPNADAIGWEEPIVVDVSFPQIAVDKGGDSCSFLGGCRDVPWNVDASCKVNDEDISLKNPQVWINRSVRAGGAYHVDWTTRLYVSAGDRVRCGTEGTDAQGRTIPRAGFDYEVKEKGKNEQYSGEWGSESPSNNYRLQYRLEFPENVDFSTANLL